LSDEWLSDIKSGICELPLAKQMRFVTEHGLSEYDAGVLTADRATAEFFDEAVKAGGDPKRLCNLISQVGLKLAREKECSLNELGITVENAAELAKMVEAGDVNATAAVTIFEKMTETDDGPQAIAEKLNLIQKSDAGELEVIVDEILAANAEAVGQIKEGSKKAKKARGFLMGEVMKKTKGQANPKVVSEILGKKLSS
jgi:aspartyl-tRNA(Asn)/glutamyl-tRNA(Gln) amidotransferase subunit B